MQAWAHGLGLGRTDLARDMALESYQQEVLATGGTHRYPEVPWNSTAGPDDGGYLAGDRARSNHR